MNQFTSKENINTDTDSNNNLNTYQNINKDIIDDNILIDNLRVFNEFLNQLNNSDNDIIPNHNDKTNNNSYNNYKLLKIKIKILRDNLYKYSITQRQYYIHIINDILYDEKKTLVCKFKELLIWNETCECFKK